jgi:hypothetical protein
MVYHFDILSNNLYSTVKLYQLINGKNFLINNSRDQRKIGIILNKTNKRNDNNFKKNIVQIPKNTSSLKSDLSKYENRNINNPLPYRILTTKNELNMKNNNTENFFLNEYSTYSIEFDSYSFFTSFPIPNLSCINCDSEIELESIQFNNQNEDDIMIFNCLGECGKFDISIKEYLTKFIPNTYLYKKCFSCEKLQLNENNNNIFNHCLNCNKIFVLIVLIIDIMAIII